MLDTRKAVGKIVSKVTEPLANTIVKASPMYRKAMADATEADAKMNTAKSVRKINEAMKIRDEKIKNKEILNSYLGKTSKIKSTSPNADVTNSSQWR